MLPDGTRTASIGGIALPLARQKLTRVAGLGDTGCRLKAGKSKNPKHGDEEEDGGQFQECNHPSKWPFKSIADHIAEADVDLVVHVGDYVYRESPCPSEMKGCTGSPTGDTWEAWQADFFTPAARLLATSPWIAVRGNHETCSRAGNGYMVFLDPRVLQGGKVDLCRKNSAPFPTYTVTVGNQAFVVMDSSDADDLCKAKAKCNEDEYRNIFDKLQRPSKGAWLVTHKPLRAVQKGPKYLTAALKDQPPKKMAHKFAFSVSGHVHFWSILGFAGKQIPQIVIGNGGTLQDGTVEGGIDGKKFDGTTIAPGLIDTHWGYTLFEPYDSGWIVKAHSDGGKIREACTIHEWKVKCTKSRIRNARSKEADRKR